MIWEEKNIALIFRNVYILAVLKSSGWLVSLVYEIPL